MVRLILYYKNVCPKQADSCFLVNLTTFLIAQSVGSVLYFQHVFKTSGKVIFSLSSYFYNKKNVCSKQVGGYF